jgi:glycosyltransferase involved in cell wall biosynthesis
MKIAIVTPYALPEKGAASMRVESFLNYFNSKGHKTTIYTPLKKTQKKNKRKDVIRYASIANLANQLKKEDKVIITAPPVRTAFMLLPFLRLYRIPFIYDSRDLGAVNNKKYKRTKMIMERICVNSAAKVSTATDYTKNFYIKNYKANPKKIKTIENGVDRRLVHYVKGYRKKIRKKLNIPEKSTTIVYTGILGKNHDIEGFVNTLDENFMKKHDLYIVMILIVGETEQKSTIRLGKIEKMIKERKLKNRFRIIKNINPEDIKKYLSSFDFGITPMLSNKDNLYTLPVKTFEYISCNLAVIGVGAKNGEIDKFLKNRDFSFFLHNWKDFKSKFENFMKNKKKIKIPKKILELIDRKNSAKKMLKFIKE